MFQFNRPGSHTRSRWLHAIAVAASLWAAAQTPMVALAAPLPIRICSIDDRSAPAADMGNDGYRGLALAVEEINAAGGIAGRTIEVKTYDGKIDPMLAGSFSARCAEDDKGLAIVGGTPTASALSMVPVSTEERIPLFTLAASMNELTEPVKPFHFRVGSANRQDALVLAEMLEKQGFKRVALVGSSAPFGIDGPRALSPLLDKKKIQRSSPHKPMT